ncbi:hypothetical protein [Phycicoccus flavus]|uniref:hypothetical protein n=1 Tax=Phycicoccus flavus TaxID=2502783 RepID=UPI000FEC06CD|nr:hypothetical protein [Phycicoccus flavus]NHA68102.1 hypothetical protein [Phycicoccus flavus]
MGHATGEIEALAVRVRLARESVEARRVALARYALVWWEGEAADRYRELVDERRAGLARLADELGWLEESVVALAAVARAEGAADPVREAS